MRALIFTLSLLPLTLFADETKNVSESKDTKKPPKSGPTIGTTPRVFYVKDCTGDFSKEIKTCYRCNYGIRPVVGVFGRELDQNTVKLLQGLDKQLDSHRKSENNAAKQLAGFFVLMTDNPDAGAAKLKRLQRKLKLRHVPLTVFDGTNGPPGYRIHKDATVTVSMWVRSAVKNNHVFAKKTELKPDAIRKLLAATTKIAPRPTGKDDKSDAKTKS